MKIKISAVLVMIFLSGLWSYGQENKGVIKGRVFNAKNNEPVPFASVVIWGTTTGAMTDFDGNFLFTGVQPGFVELRASSVGFKPYISEAIMVTNSKEVSLEIPLEETTVDIEDVVVKASPFRRRIESPVSARLIGIDEIEKNPGGNRDISKVIQSFPGVASTPAFRNDVIVRGGGPNENRFYIDNVEIPYLNHFSTQGASGGPVGIINVDFVREVDFLSGAFPATRGNALSSILNFSLIDGNRDKFKYRATLGASDLGLTADGPTGENGSLILSVRRSYLQFLFSAIGLPFLPTYTDFQFKHKVRLDSKNELTVLGLGAKDDFRLNLDANDTEYQRYILDYIPVQEQYSYTVGAVWKRYRDNGFDTWVISRNYLNNTQFKYMDNIEADTMLILDYKSGEGENKLRYESVYIGDKGFRLSYGAGYENALYRNSTFRKIPVAEIPVELSYKTDLRISKFSLFSQISRAFANERLNVSLGVRTDFNNYSPEMSNPLKQLSPRLAASFNLSPEVSLNFSTGRFYQLPPYTAMGYRNNSGEFANRDNGLAYISADHIVAGLGFAPTENSQFTLEGFYKSYSRYPFSVIEGVPLSGKSADYGIFGDEELVPTATGRAYGVELLGRLKEFRGTNMVFAYTFVRSEFRGPGQDYIPTAWDNRHLFSMTATTKLKRNWDAGVKWRYVGGAPYTPYNESFSALIDVWDVTGQGVRDFSGYNSLRLKAFHQLDIRVDKQYFFDRWSLMLYADVQNVYNHQADQSPILIRESTADGEPVVDPADPTRYKLKYISGTVGTVLPTIGVIIEF
ncbi:MAG: TonB-dependent receptor [Bacteroidales bacterium]|nr:TonB-dependent receptor [Bacteroidales bacterium]